jgi:hypothetical protein
MNAGVGDACTSGSSYSASCNASWAELGSAAGGLTAARLPCLPYAPAPPACLLCPACPPTCPQTPQILELAFGKEAFNSIRPYFRWALPATPRLAPLLPTCLPCRNYMHLCCPVLPSLPALSPLPACRFLRSIYPALLPRPCLSPCLQVPAHHQRVPRGGPQAGKPHACMPHQPACQPASQPRLYFGRWLGRTEAAAAVAAAAAAEHWCHSPVVPAALLATHPPTRSPPACLHLPPACPASRLCACPLRCPPRATPPRWTSFLCSPCCWLTCWAATSPALVSGLAGWQAGGWLAGLLAGQAGGSLQWPDAAWRCWLA